MKKNINKKIKKLNKNNIFYFFNFLFFIILIFLTIISTYFSFDNFKHLFKFGINYSDSYRFQINIFNTKDENYDPLIPNGDNKIGLNLLKNKLDPLNNSDLYLQTLGNNSLELIIGKDKFNSKKELINFIERLGGVFFTDKNGNDLLIEKNKRIILNEIISNATSGIDVNRKPIITLKIKNLKKWEENIIKKIRNNNEFNKEKINNQNLLFIWTDLGQMINNLRNDIDNISLITRNFQSQIINKIKQSDIKKYIYSIFDVEYKDLSSGSQLVNDNLLLMSNNMPISKLKFIMKDKSFNFTSVKLKDLIINSNDKNDVKNKYIDPIRKYLFYILNWSKEINKKYKVFLLNYDFLFNKKNNIFNPFENIIYCNTETESKIISNLINCGLSGLKFVIRGFDDIKFNFYNNKNIFIYLFIILLLIIIIIFIYFIFNYRLFGIVSILSSILTVSLTLFFSSLLKISLNIETILAIIIIFYLILIIDLLFFLRYKKEKYKNNLSSELSAKIAYKQTNFIFLDCLIILIIFGLSFFWISKNNIKLFSIILLIGVINSFLVYFFINRFIYLLIFKLKLQLKFKIFDIPDKIFFKKNNKNKKNNILIFKNNNIDINNEKILYFLNNNNNDKKNNYINNKKNIFLLFNYKKNIMFIILIFFIFLFFIFLFFEKNNYYNNNFFKQGTNINIYDNNWINKNEIKETDIIKTQIKKFKNKEKYNFVYNIYIINSLEKEKGNKFLVIKTNILKEKISKKLLLYIADSIGASIEDPGFFIEKTTFLMEKNILISIILSILISIFFIFIYYSFFKLKWMHFLTIFSNIILLLFSLLLIIFFSNFFITFNFFISFVFLIIFSLLFSSIILSLIEQNKKNINIKEYKEFYSLINKIKKQFKEIKKNHKLYFYNELKKEKLNYSIFNIKKNNKNKFLKIKKETKKIKINNKKFLKIQKKEFNIYLCKYDILKNIAKKTINQIFLKILFLGFFLIFLLIILGLFTINLFEIFNIIIIGIIIFIFYSIFLIFKIWSYFEKINILNKIKFKNYLNKEKIEKDEQNVLDINC